MGLFSRKPSTAGVAMSVKDLNDKDLRAQDRLLEKAKTAEAAYDVDKNKGKLIKAYESVLCHNPPLRSNSRAQKLAKLYIEEGREKEAKVFLNMCIANKLMPLYTIRTMQGDMEKKDGQYLRAIEFYLASGLASECGAVVHDYTRYANKIRPCVKKMMWSEDDTNSIVDILAHHIKKRDFNEVNLADAFRKFVKKKGIEEF